jgi:cell division protease FtsH
MLPQAPRRLWWVFLGLLALNFVLSLALSGKPARHSVPYTLFYQQVQQGNVREISSKGDEIQGSFRMAVKYPSDKGGKKSTKFKTVRPTFGDDGLSRLLIGKKVTVNAHPVDTGTPVWQTIVFGFGPTLLLVGLFVALARRSASGGMLGSFGRSRARRYEHSAQRTSFKDVAGIDEAEAELVEVVDFLRNPDRYRKVGGTIPRGVLLAGLPGTGKTLLARAVAGEADVPFFSISASEFIEAIVGVGASRVRDLFNQAKEAAPAIIFIDELDAIGRARGGGASLGGHDEREQTLNQILTEMDGFTGTEGVIVLGATNRPEILDPALLRPGRFDRRVFVNPPDRKGRQKILEVHTRSVPLADDVELAQVAASTPGMVGADLRNLVNEAALTAARRGHEKVAAADFSDALEKIVLGTERRITLSPEERERTAYHESGHALLGMLEPGADPVRKVSIIPRGQALGVTFQSPDADRYGYGASYLRGRIVGALGGRAAEEIVFGDVTTGAESDLEQITSIARQMVGRWGMSDAVGLVSVLPRPGNEPALFPGSDSSAPSESTRELVDAEVRRIVEECYSRAIERLRENRDRLDSLSKALLEHETLDERDAYAAAGFDRPPATAEQGARATVVAHDVT